MRHTICISLLVFFSVGCAIHSPMSEMVMFHEKRTTDGEVYQARYSHALLSVTTDIYSEQEFVEYVNRHHPLNSNESSYNYRPPLSVVTHAIFMSDKTDIAAFSLAVGNALGADATLKIVGNMYVTGSVGFPGEPQYMFILQQRLLDGNPVGLSLGVTAARNYQIIGIDSDSYCGFLCYHTNEFYSTSTGVRAVFMLSAPPVTQSARLFLYTTMSYNYDFTMDLFYPRVGVALGLY